MGRYLWVVVVECRAGAEGMGVGGRFFIAAGSRGWVMVNVRCKVMIRSGLSLRLG